MPFSVSWDGRLFFSCHIELIRQNGRPVVIDNVQGRLVTAGYRSRHPDRRPQTASWSSLPTPHVGRQALKVEPSALVSCNTRWWVHGRPLPLWLSFQRIPSVSWMQQSSSLSTTQQKLRHAHYSFRGWLWTHQQMAHETSADGSTSDACVLTYGGGGHGQESVRASVWLSWEISICY